MIKSEFNNEEFQAALATAYSSSTDVKPISKITPHIVGEGNTAMAHGLVCATSANRDYWLPEALALFNVPGLSQTQRKRMVGAVFSDETPLDEATAAALADCNARMGRYGFSFPQWRFVSQGFDGSALVEQFGMAKIPRDNDVRDPTLPKSTPERDEFGLGFVWGNGDWNVEYRRAYILCSNHCEDNAATLVIRNNSYFFGRDRLPAPFYASFEPIEAETLQTLDTGMLEQSGLFSRWQDITHANQSLPLEEKVRRTQHLLNFLDAFDARLALWLQSPEPINDASSFEVLNNLGTNEGGQLHLLAFLKHMHAIHAASGKLGSPLFMAQIDANMPPWHPNLAVPLSDDLIEQIETGSFNMHEPNTKIVMLSGPNGDWPLMKPKPNQDKASGRSPAP